MYDIDLDNFDKGYNMGVKHVIEHIESALFYISEAWKTQERDNVVYNTVKRRLEDCKRLMINKE